MYAPVAAVEPQRPDLQRGASAAPDVAHERKRSLKQLPPASSRRATIKRTALVVAGIALVAAAVVAALHFVKSDAFDTLIQWLQVCEEAIIYIFLVPAKDTFTNAVTAGPRAGRVGHLLCQLRLLHRGLVRTR